MGRMDRRPHRSKGRVMALTQQHLIEDAARYQYLRDRRPELSGVWVALGVVGIGVSQWSGEPLDRLIDESIAMTEQEP